MREDAEIKVLTQGPGRGGREEGLCSRSLSLFCLTGLSERVHNGELSRSVSVSTTAKAIFTHIYTH